MSKPTTMVALIPSELPNPAITTRGFKEAEAELLANWMCDVLENIDDEALAARVAENVTALCHKFPVYAK